MLEVRGVSKRFGGVTAIEDLSFSVAAGEFVSIIGPNGAGKTSAFNVISGAYIPDRGDVLLLGTSLRGRGISEISHAGVARTFQTLQIFGSMTALENVMVPLEARGVHGSPAFGEAKSLLERVGLGPFAQSEASNLSFGQQRLLEIARALAARPRLLLLDEPTSGLSRAECRSVMEVLRRLSADGLTILMIEHDIKTVMEESDRVIVLDRGKLLAAGAPADVQRDPKVVEAYLGPGLGEARESAQVRKSDALLELRGLVTRRGTVRALDGVDLTVNAGETLAIVGPNGAGKSTLLGTIAGLYRSESGSVRFRDTDVSGLGAEQIVRRGIGLVPERRQMFEELSVERNLLLGAYARGKPSAAELERIFQLFPRLRDRREQRAGSLSGGEQQMVAIARGLLSNPSVLLLDEPSLGLAPKIVEEIFKTLLRINEEGTTVVVVEQNARAAFAIADRVAILERGRIAAIGKTAEIAGDRKLMEAYLG
jgi:ABC-type branched-subunit amino acid transport system ATPase component